MSTTWKIYWWAKTDRPKKYGNDTIVVQSDSFDEQEAEDLLEYFANGYMPDEKHPEMKNFFGYYPDAVFCENYGLVKIKQVKEKEASK